MFRKVGQINRMLKLFQNKKGQKNLRDPTKKQSFFVGSLNFFWPFFFWSGFIRSPFEYWVCSLLRLGAFNMTRQGFAGLSEYVFSSSCDKWLWIILWSEDCPAPSECASKGLVASSGRLEPNICSKRIGALWLFSSARLSFSLFWKKSNFLWSFLKFFLNS